MITVSHQQILLNSQETPIYLSRSTHPDLISIGFYSSHDLRNSNAFTLEYLSFLSNPNARVPKQAALALFC